jgi:O-methyltransferase
LVKHLIRKPYRILCRRLCRLPRFQRTSTYFINESKFADWIAANPCEDAPDRWKLYRSIIDREGLRGPIDYLEFGVFRGESIRWWTENNDHPESSFVGFDSFEGLPENWQHLPQGAFSVAGALPDIQDPRCQFIKGWFQDTLVDWLDGRRFPRQTVVHLDADLYSSTLFVLIHLLPRLKKGDILVFDQFDDILHEFKAFLDATAAYPARFEALSHTPGWIRVVMKMV